MATIKPFRALRPDPFLADQLIFPSNEQVFFFGIGEKTLPLKPLKDQLETPARKRPETEEGQMLAYEEIKANIDTLKKLGRIRLEEEPGIFIYEIVHRDYRQTGIWALTSIKDYSSGKIKIHEQTLADSERRICNYRKHTGLEGSPVLLTYPPDRAVNLIIAETIASQKQSTVGSKKSQHRIWKIQDTETLKDLVAAFAKIEQVYLADGHHRLAATERLSKENGADAFVSSLYIASDQLRIIDYHRVILPDLPINKDCLLKRLAEIAVINIGPSRRQKGVIGMQIGGQNYELALNDHAALDVVSLQEQILAPLFGITDPRTDPHLKCVGGEEAIQDIAAILKAVPDAVAFTLCPMTVEQLIAAGATGQVLPPKSTWIDPKVPYGLLLYQHHYKGRNISQQHYD